MAAVVTDVLAHGAATVRSDILERRRLRSRSGNHDRIVHSAGFSELVDNLGYGRALLADGDVDTDNVAAFLIDDGVNGDRSLARLPITDDQFPLASANRNHAVNSLQSGL